MHEAPSRSINLPGPARDVGGNAPEAALLRRLVDSNSVSVAYWDASLRCRYANDAFATGLGLSPKQLRGRHIRDVLGPEFAANLPYIEGALRGTREEFERDLADAAGGPPRQSLSQYVPDVVDGRVRGFFALGTDVSALKRAERAERAMRESEALFRLTIDEAPIGMALVAPDGHFVRVNHALCEIVDYTADELTGRTFQSITHPDDLDADLHLLGRLARAEIPRYTMEKRYYRKDGSLVDIQLSVSVVRGHDGTPEVYIAQIQDISARKRVERERALLAEIGPLLASTLDFEETLTQIANIVVRHVSDFCVVDLVDKEGAPRRLRVATRDPSKAEIADVFLRTPIDAKGPYLLRAVLETQRPICLQHLTREVVATFARSAEHLRALEAVDIHALVAVPLIAHARLVGVIAFVSSNPSQRYGKEDVRFAEELAQRAALSIENAQLYREAKRATRARDDVLAVVVHDLRNPLSNILLQASVLGRCSDDSAQRDHARGAIERAANRMNRLVQDLLDVVRLESGTLRIEPSRVAPEQLVVEAIASQQTMAANASLALRTQLSADLPDVMADRDRILQVFENLIGNAIKFTPAGGRVTVAATRRDDDVLFSVADSGSGIAAEDLPRVFDRFWQARKAERRGAGLGLPIVKGVIESHHGRIWVESTLGAGSTFYFTLPSTSESSRS